MNTPIESGPTTERKIRILLILLMCAVFSVWFSYDGWVGYPAKNFNENLEQLPTPDREKAKNARVYETVTPQNLEAAKTAIKKFNVAEQRKALETLFGGPPSYENDKAWYYFGPYYHLKVRIKDGRTQRVFARKTVKQRKDIIWQRRLGVGLGIITVAMCLFLIRVMRTHLRVDDKGLRWRRKELILWDEISSLNAARFKEKGWVNLIYHQGGKERQLKLDEYHLAKFDEIIERICLRKGFDNPLESKQDADQ